MAYKSVTLRKYKFSNWSKCNANDVAIRTSNGNEYISRFSSDANNNTTRKWRSRYVWTSSSWWSSWPNKLSRPSDILTLSRFTHLFLNLFFFINCIAYIKFIFNICISTIPRDFKCLGLPPGMVPIWTYKKDSLDFRFGIS